MPLRAHLRELRRRFFLAAIGVLLGAVAGWFAYEPVFEALIRPLQQVATQRHEIVAINFSGLVASFDMQVQVALFLGVLLSSPWWIGQLWAFVTPGLTRRERGYAVSFLAVGVPLFLAGAALAWWALPNAVRFLTAFTPAGATNLIDAQTYMSFVMRLILAFGLAFLLPVVMVALTLAGVVRARTWVGGWRWAVVVIFVFAAVVTPTPDAFTMLGIALPMTALYGAAMWVCVAHDRREDRRRVAAGLPRLDGTVPGERRTGTGGRRPPVADA